MATPKPIKKESEEMRDSRYKWEAFKAGKRGKTGGEGQLQRDMRGNSGVIYEAGGNRSELARQARSHAERRGAKDARPGVEKIKSALKKAASARSASMAKRDSATANRKSMPSIPDSIIKRKGM